MKKILVFFVLLVMFLCSCNVKHDTNDIPVYANNDEETLGKYSNSSKELPLSLSSAYAIKHQGSSLYFIGFSEDSGHYALYKYELGTEECAPFNIGTKNTNIVDFQFDNSGNIVVLYDVPPSDMDYEIKLAVGTQEKRLRESVIEIFTIEGESLWKYSITEERWKNNDNTKRIVDLNANSIGIVDDSIICLNSYCSSDGQYDEAVFSIDKSSVRSDFPMLEKASLLNSHSIIVSQNKAYLANSKYPYYVMPIDLDNKDYLTEMPLAIPDSNQSGQAGKFYSDGENLFFSNATGLYNVETNTGTAKQILDWLKNDISITSVNGVTKLDEKIIFLSEPDFEKGQTAGMLNELSFINESESKITLTLGTLYLDTSMKKAILDFNQNNSKYKVEVIDYSKYNTHENDAAGAEKLNMDIIAGDIPDIIELSDVPHVTIQSAKNKDVFLELEQFIEADESFCLDNFFPNLIDSLRDDTGKLFELSPAFTLITMVGHNEDFINFQGISWDDLFAMAEGLSDGQKIFSGDDSYALLLLLLDIDSYIDWQNGECRFNSDEFISYLEFVRDYLPQNASHYDYDENGSQFKEGANRLALVTFEGLNHLAETMNNLGGDTSVAGLPSNRRNIAVFFPTCRLAISAQSKESDASWEFIKYVMNNSGVFDPNQLSANIDAFEKNLKQATIELTDQPGKAMVGGRVIPLIGDELSVLLSELVKRADGIYTYDSNIYQILNDEINDYLQNKTTSKQAAEHIQQRATTLVNERIG